MKTIEVTRRDIGKVRKRLTEIRGLIRKNSLELKNDYSTRDAIKIINFSDWHEILHLSIEIMIEALNKVLYTQYKLV